MAVSGVRYILVWVVR